MALTFAAYTVPPAWQRPVAVVAVLALAAANYRGITRTARLSRLLLSMTVLALVLVIAVGLGGGADVVENISGGLLDAGWYGLLQSAGLLFFAFAGYARIATLGEEVRDPGQTIPRAIQIALGLTVVVYAAVAVTLLAVLGPDGVAEARAPLAAAVTTGASGWAAPVVRVGAAAASLGALLALLAGVGRTGLAMAREGDLPAWLAAVHPRFQVPHHAETALAIAVCALVLTGDLRGAIGFSSFGVLLYYLVTNLAAFGQSGAHRRFPRVLQLVGVVGCVVLAATLPWTSVLSGIVVLAVGIGLRLFRV